MKDSRQTAFSSRQYMISRDFEIYYYRDRNLLQMESHRHDYYEFYFFMEGEVSLRIEEEELPLRAGDVVVIPPDVRHCAVIHNPESNYCRFVLWISREYYQRLTSGAEDYGYLTSHTQIAGCRVIRNDRLLLNAIQSRLFQLIEELHAQRYGKQTALALCISDLLLCLNRLAYEEDHPQKGASRESLYAALIRYIDEHLSEPLTLDSLAGAFFVSKYHIAHVFKDNIGISVSQYIIKKRLRACREAILEGTGISEAYRRYGFSDYSSFFRAFKKEFGIPPRDCRAQSARASESIT